MKKKLIFSAALLLSLGLAGCGETATKDDSTNDSKQEASAPAAKAEGKLTEEKFKQIKDGMTYEEVVKIIGAEGTIMSETGSAGEPHHTVMYEFETDGVMSSSTMMFQGGKLINKAQFGVETSDIEITLEQFNKLENGMTKEQVFNILGGEGAVLSESGDIVMYTYNGKSLGGNASLMFQGGKLMNKTQLGLE
ncbi:DUF3862 domain-containing protein [Lysinibacillus sphaericus]|nr:DUF3862 domain-containing protein [Lysinibacillus sphaericus]MDM5350490.1 DUF3862 domain-containing protein [Lysinibacillus sphaericus]QPA56627.1 DUF3862 domain-containing protein [Lysinibacillus sphaericus]